MGLVAVPNEVLVITSQDMFQQAVAALEDLDDMPRRLHPSFQLGEDMWAEHDSNMEGTVWIVDPSTVDGETSEIIENRMYGLARHIGQSFCKIVHERFRILGSPQERVEKLAGRLISLYDKAKG